MFGIQFQDKSFYSKRGFHMATKKTNSLSINFEGHVDNPTETTVCVHFFVIFNFVMETAAQKQHTSKNT